jgi:hypothetical protein
MVLSLVQALHPSDQQTKIASFSAQEAHEQTGQPHRLQTSARSRKSAE